MFEIIAELPEHTMKKRSDFVTNSSSSSFIIAIRASLDDDIEFYTDGEEFHGDEEGSSLNIGASIAGREEIFDICCNPYIDFFEGELVEEPDDVPEYLIYELGFSLNIDNMNLSEIADKSNKEIGKYFKDKIGFIDEYYDEEDEELDEDNENYIETILQLKNRLVEARKKAGELFQMHWSDNGENRIKITMDFDGFGELSYDTDQILAKIYGEENANEILEITDAHSDDDEAIEILKDKPYLENVTKESVKTLVDFIRHNESCYGDVSFTQVLEPDRTVTYSIILKE